MVWLGAAACIPAGAAVTRITPQHSTFFSHTCTGRDELHQLRVLDPAHPDISVRYNPFYCGDEDYTSVVNMVFGSFNLHDEFFAKHPLNYLADIVRVLVNTGLP